MYIQKISPEQLEKARAQTALSMHTFRYLNEGGYRIYTRYSVDRNALYYGAVLKDKADGAKHLALPDLSFGIKSDGNLIAETTVTTAPLVCYIYDHEKDMSDEEFACLYGPIYEQIALTGGLSPEQARIKLEMRESFKTFLQKLDRAETVDQQVSSDTFSARISVELSPVQGTCSLSMGITLLSSRKEYPIKDLYQFLTGFKTRSTFALTGKASVTLDGSSFTPPYDQVLPLMATLFTFSRKAKTSTATIACDRALPILDLLQKEKLIIKGKISSIAIKDPVSMLVNEQGLPEFKPPFKSEKAFLFSGKKGVYEFAKDSGSISFYPFESIASRQTYQYFKEQGLSNFEYIRDMFAKELLPRVASSVKFKKDDTTENPFGINLYLTFDDKERLQFKTVYTENGKEVDRSALTSSYATSIAGAYLSVLESMSGIENGVLSADASFAFLSKDLTPLSRLCNLFCDERLKPGHVNMVNNLKVTVGKTGGYLDLTLDHDRYSPEELSAILAAYHRKKRYFLLKDTTLLLYGDELEEAGHIFKNDSVHLDHAPIYHMFSLDSGKMKIQATKEAHEVLTAIRNFTKTPCKLPDRFKGELKPYQVEGVKYLRTIAENGLGAILADEMGLGKTVQTIAYLTLDFKNDLNLVICPKAVIYNWESEIRRFSDLPVQIVDGTKENREKILTDAKAAKKAGGLILITSYDTFRRDSDLYENISFKNVFLDEAQSIKNAFSQRHQSLSSLHAKHRFALTGTPLENSQTDIWSIFDFLMPGYLNSLVEFSEKLGDEKHDRQIASLVKPFILRRLKKDVIKDLPEKTETNIMIGMDSTQRAIYLSYLQEIRNTMHATKGIAVLAGLTRLRQLCVDPSVVYDNYDEVSSKLSYCRDLINECKSNGHKAIVFSSFKSILVHLKELLEDEYSLGMITGDTPAKERLSLAETFNTTDKLDAMLVSLKAGGVGLNLIGADCVILLDPWWNPSAEEQASGRAHRIGQTHSVSVFRLIAKDSIEEKVHTLQQMKKDLFDTIVEGTGGASKLSEEDIAFILD
ncbi:MAG: SNF2 helicase associated domain-containing protein [Clostridia bacterium]|nr:SNF2 helicase associated domain-containing protein [Clostridia bacterium]